MPYRSVPIYIKIGTGNPSPTIGIGTTINVGDGFPVPHQFNPSLNGSLRGCIMGKLIISLESRRILW